LDYRIFHAVDEFARDHKWLAHAIYTFEEAHPDVDLQPEQVEALVKSSD